MLKKKVGNKLAERAAALRKKHKQGKAQPQWDELEAWCRQTTDTLNTMNTKLNVITVALKPSKNVTPELEEAINRNAALATHVDSQVPDEERK